MDADTLISVFGPAAAPAVVGWFLIRHHRAERTEWRDDQRREREEARRASERQTDGLIGAIGALEQSIRDQGRHS